MNKSKTFATKGLEIEKPKESPQDQGHQGATASFAIKETNDAIEAIRAKLESAERRQTLGFGKGAKVQKKKKVKEFAQPVQENDNDDSEEQDVVFRKPVSGSSSRRKVGKASVEKPDSKANDISIEEDD